MSDASFESDLIHLRHEVDKIDAQILVLIQRRTQLACSMGELKRKMGRPLKDATREAAVLANVLQQNATNAQPLHIEPLVAIYKQLFALALAAQS